MAYPEHIIKRAIELKEGRSASAVLRILDREFPEEVVSLDVTTILRWIRTKSELLVEPSVHMEKEQGETPSSISENLYRFSARSINSGPVPRIGTAWR